MQVEKDDGLPNRICALCKSKLELFNRFKHACEQSDKILRERLTEKVHIKIEETILPDEEWTNYSNNTSPYNIYDVNCGSEKHVNTIDSNEVLIRNIEIEDVKPNLNEFSYLKLEKNDEEIAAEVKF